MIFFLVNKQQKKMSSNLFVFIVIILYSTHAATLTNCNGIFTPSELDIIICDNTCDTCHIRCNSKDQCKEVKMYSGALNTKIECTTETACKNSFMYIGTTGTYPNGYGFSNFDRQYNYTEIICNGNTACAVVRIDIMGYFENGGFVNIIGGQDDVFKDSHLDVDIQTGNSNTYFNLECPSSITGCENVDYQCQNANCECDGEIDNLNSVCNEIFTNVNTRNPTQFGIYHVY